MSDQATIQAEVQQPSIYSFMKENGLTDKSEQDFNTTYADSTKAKGLYDFFVENKLTDKDFGTFYKNNLIPKAQERQTSYIPEVPKYADGEPPSLLNGLAATRPDLSIKHPEYYTPKISDSYQTDQYTTMPQGTGNRFKAIDQNQLEQEAGGAKIAAPEPKVNMDYGDHIGNVFVSGWHSLENMGASMLKSSIFDNINANNGTGYNGSPIPQIPADQREELYDKVTKPINDWQSTIPKDPDVWSTKVGGIAPFIGIAASSIIAPETAPLQIPMWYKMGKGEGLDHATQIEKETGEKMTPEKKMAYEEGYGLALSALSMATGHLIPEATGKYLVNSLFKNAPEILPGLEGTLKGFIEQTPKGAKAVANYLADYGTGVIKSAAGMEAMDLGKIVTDKALGEKYDLLNRFTSGLKGAVESGAIFESILFPFSRLSKTKAFVDIDNHIGTVNLGVIKDEPVKLYQSDNEYYGIKPDGSRIKATQADYDNGMIIPTQTFYNNLESGKVSPSIHREIYAGKAKLMVNRLADSEGKIHAVQNEDGNLTIITHKDKDGSLWGLNTITGEPIKIDEGQLTYQNSGWIEKSFVYSNLLKRYDQYTEQVNDKTIQSPGSAPSGSVPSEPVNPRQTFEAQTRQLADLIVNPETGILTKTQELNGDPDTPPKTWYINIGTINDIDGTVGVIDENGNKEIKPISELSKETEDTPYEEFISLGLQGYDQQVQAQGQVKQEQDQINQRMITYNGQKYYVSPTDYEFGKDNEKEWKLHPLTEQPDGTLAEEEDSQPIYMPQSQIDQIVAEQQTINPKVSMPETGENESLPPSQDNGLTQNGKNQEAPKVLAYSYKGEEITQEEAKDLVDLAILKNNPDKLIGLKYEKDSKLDELINKAWPKPVAVFKLNGKKITPAQAKTHIKFADSFDELNELKSENIESEPDIQAAYNAKVKEFTPTQISQKENTESQEVKKVPENPEEVINSEPVIKHENDESLQKSKSENTDLEKSLQNGEGLGKNVNLVNAINDAQKDNEYLIGKGDVVIKRNQERIAANNLIIQFALKTNNPDDLYDIAISYFNAERNKLKEKYGNAENDEVFSAYSDLRKIENYTFMSIDGINAEANPEMAARIKKQEAAREEEFKQRELNIKQPISTGQPAINNQNNINEKSSQKEPEPITDESLKTVKKGDWLGTGTSGKLEVIDVKDGKIYTPEGWFDAGGEGSASRIKNYGRGSDKILRKGINYQRNEEPIKQASETPAGIGSEQTKTQEETDSKELEGNKGLTSEKDGKNLSKFKKGDQDKGQQYTDEQIAEMQDNLVDEEPELQQQLDNNIKELSLNLRLLDVCKDLFDGKDIAWDKIEEKLNNDLGYFTQFPFDLNDKEINELKSVIQDESKRKEYETATRGRTDNEIDPFSSEPEGDNPVGGIGNDGSESKGTEPEAELTPTEKLKPVVEHLESNSTFQSGIQYKTIEELINELGNKISEEEKESIIASNFQAMSYKNEIVFNSKSIQSNEDIIRSWVHEKSHIQLFRNFNFDFNKKKKYFTDLYNKVGKNEIRRVIPKGYFKDDIDVQGEEYLVHLAETYAVTGEISNQVKPEIRKEVENLINSFTSLKNIQDAKQSQSGTEVQSGNTGRNSDARISNGSGIQSNTGDNGREGLQLDGSLSDNESGTEKPSFRIDKSLPLSDYLSQAKQSVQENKSDVSLGEKPNDMDPNSGNYKIDLLNNTEYIETGETRIDKDYEPDDVEYNQRKVFIPVYLNNWSYADNTDPNTEQFDTVNEALSDLMKAGDMSEVDSYYTPAKETQLAIKEAWIGSDGEIIEEGKIQSYDDWAYHNKSNEFVKKFGEEGLIDSKTFDGREDSARKLEEEVYFGINKGILKSYSGLKLSVQERGKYRTISVEDKNGNDIGFIQIRIADHSYNPINNNNSARSGNFISVEIANKNETKGKFNGSFGLQFDGDNTYSEVIDAINDRIKEIIDGWDIKKELPSAKSENEIVAFNPSQIKSTGNNGDFDPNNPNINFKKGDREEPLTDYLTNALSIFPGYTELKDGLEKFGHSIKVTSSPYTHKEGGKLGSEIMREKLGQMQRQLDQAAAQLKTASNAFDKMSNDDNLKFIDNMERGLPQKNEVLQSYSDALREAIDQARDRVRGLGTGKLDEFIENYFPHNWTDPVKAGQFNGVGKRPMEGSKAFLKKRTIEFTVDGVANGLTPISWNPVKLTLIKLREMERYTMAHRTLNELKELGYVKFVRIGQQRPEGYKEIDDKVGKVMYKNNSGALEYSGNYFAEENVARIINNFLSKGLRGKLPFDIYRGLGNMLTQFQLGLSAFHIGFTSMDATISKAALGLEYLYHGKVIDALKHFAEAPLAPVTNLISGDKLMKAWYGNPSTVEMAAIADFMETAGGRAKMDDFYKENFKDRLIENFRNKRYLSAGLQVPLHLVELMAKPIMEYIVPRQKLGVFMDMVRYDLEVNPNLSYDQRRKNMQNAWNSVDNRMGQMVYDNLFWNRITKDIAMATVRSVGWNLGTFREVGGAPNEAVDLFWKGFQGKRADETHKIAYFISLVAITALYSAIIMFLRTGKKPEELKDYFFPKDGGIDKNGDATRVSLPTYTKDLYHYGTAPVQTLMNKLSPVNGLVSQTIKNKDYYGTKIWNEDDPYTQKGIEYLEYMGTQLIPFGIRNAQKNQNGDIQSKILPFIGITPAPYDLNMSNAEEKMHEIMAQKMPEGGRTKEQAEHSKLISQLRNDYIKTKHLNLINQALVRKDIDLNEFYDILSDSRLTPIERAAKKMQLTELFSIYNIATPEEKKQIKPILRSKVIEKQGTILNQIDREEINTINKAIK